MEQLVKAIELCRSIKREEQEALKERARTRELFDEADLRHSNISVRLSEARQEVLRLVWESEA